MTATTDRLERRCRQLLRCYPPAWRQRHEDELVAVLLDQAEAEGRTTVAIATALDLIGHGAEERLESLLRWLPTRLREQVAVVALVMAAGLSLVMLVGEVLGAHFRQPAEEIHTYGAYFTSGPFLTTGVGLYVASMSAALLVVLGHGGAARLLVLTAAHYAAWMLSPVLSGGYPTPRPLILVLFAGLGGLAALATIRASRRTSHHVIGYGAGYVAAVAVALLLTKPVLDWSIGTMATSGNIALAALAVSLPIVGAGAILISALRTHRPQGWPAAIAVATFPVVVFCSAVSQAVNPAQAGPRAGIPLGYALVVTMVALTHHLRHQRRVVAG